MEHPGSLWVCIPAGKESRKQTLGLYAEKDNGGEGGQLPQLGLAGWASWRGKVCAELVVGWRLEAEGWGGRPRRQEDRRDKEGNLVGEQPFGLTM